MGRTRPALAFCALAVLASLPPLVMAPRPAVTVLSCALLALGLKTLLPLMDTAAVNLGESLKAEGRGSWDYGKLRAIGSFGFIAMALGLQAIPGFDRSPPSRIALWLAGTTVAYALSLFVLPDPGPRASKQLREGAAARRLDPVFFLGLAIIGLNRLAMAPISSFLSLFVVEDLHWDAVGGLWALSACSEIPLMILSARFIRRLGPMPVIAISGLSIALRLGIYAAFPSHGGVIVGQLLHSLCYGLFQPAAVAFVALRVPPERRAEGMAALIGLGIGLPTFLGSSLGGLMVERFGYRILFASYILFAVASLALYLRARRRFD